VTAVSLVSSLLFGLFPAISSRAVRSASRSIRADPA